MAEKTSEERIVEEIGGPWPDDPRVYTWQVTDDLGNASTMTWQWREHGGKLSTPSTPGGDIAIREARDF